MRSHMCIHGNTADCDANKLAMAHMSFVDSFPAMTFLCWTTPSLLLWLYICWAKCVNVSNSNWCITDVWACVYTAESELRPAKCAGQYIRQLLHFFHPLPVTPFVPLCQVLHQSCSLQWGCLMLYVAALPSHIPMSLWVIPALPSPPPALTNYLL